MDVSRVFQRSFKKTFKVFQKKFHVAWNSSQLPEQKEGLFVVSAEKFIKYAIFGKIQNSYFQTLPIIASVKCNVPRIF